VDIWGSNGDYIFYGGIGDRNHGPGYSNRISDNGEYHGDMSVIFLQQLDIGCIMVYLCV
jgi:hypothetical protein